MNNYDELQIENLGTAELSPELDMIIDQKIQEAEEDIEKEKKEARLQIRWRQGQMNLVKEAANLVGIPFETYAKHVLYRQAIKDIEKSKSVKQ